MIKLKNVSKFYYGKGIVSAGFSKVNLDLSIGEFVVISGESGSGKSTLLNVISGLDSYEEGEMYINGEETSHYMEKDFEEYRKKYIGNIFQNFNLVNSYTVYQNIELVLLINGYKKKDVKSKILEIIKKVDLTKYRKTKVSKLSGGQKQRVAIARALAKEVPIIVADEPTGNLDSRSAASIVRLLNELSKDKLVVIVTHNYEQFEEYATRKIKMHDGKILEDKKLKKPTKAEEAKEASYKNITFLNKLRLGLRNTFNVVPKFLLLLLVYLFVTLAVTAEYSALKKQKHEIDSYGYNMFFRDTSDKRIIINKSDRTSFTQEDYKNISSLENVDKIVKDDLMLDNSVSLNSEYFYFSGYAFDIDDFEGSLFEGRMPENDNEIVVETYKDNYYFSGSESVNNVFETEFNLMNDRYYTEILENKVKIVGIKFMDSYNPFSSSEKIYVSTKVLDNIRNSSNEYYSKTTSVINGNKIESMDYSTYAKLKSSAKVPKGSVVISADFNYMCKNYKCKNSYMKVTIENIYFTETLNLKIYQTYDSKTFKKYTGFNDFDVNNGAYYMNSADFYNLYNKNTYQSSVFVKDATKVEATIKSLEDLGYNPLYVRDALNNTFGDIAIFGTLFLTIFLTAVTIGLFFIAYFIIKIILKSRNIYFSTIRILGSSKKTANALLNIEIFTVFNLAFLIVISFIALVSKDIIKIEYIQELIKYFALKDYILLYAILFIISVFITKRYAKKLFASSAMNTYREEV